MKGIINNILTSCEMRTKTLGVLIANTEKTLKGFSSDNERKANEWAERLDSFVKDITGEVNDMFTRVWFLKERKQKMQEQMTDDQLKSLTDFARFVKTLAKDVHSLLTRFEDARDQTFEEEFDKQVRQMETNFRERLKEFDKVLTGTSDNLKVPLSKCAGDVLSCIKKPLRRTSPSDGVNVNMAVSNVEK